MANPWRYTGQYQDSATGLYKMGARYYQPELGRWTQPDPSGQDVNVYLYVSGNPVNFADPSGYIGLPISVPCVPGTATCPGVDVPSPEQVETASTAAGVTGATCTIGALTATGTVVGIPAAPAFGACAVGATFVGAALGLAGLFY